MSTFTEDTDTAVNKKISIQQQQKQQPTFLDDSSQQPTTGTSINTTITRGTEPPQQIVDSEIQTPWSNYLNSLNNLYQKKIQKYAQYSNYTFHLRYEDDRGEEKQVFARKKLLQWQFDELEDLRAEASELATTSPRKAQKALTQMYEKAATFILWNTKKEMSMTVDEYKHCEFSEIRPALDASMLLGLDR